MNQQPSPPPFPPLRNLLPKPPSEKEDFPIKLDTIIWAFVFCFAVIFLSVKGIKLEITHKISSEELHVHHDGGIGQHSGY